MMTIQQASRRTQNRGQGAFAFEAPTPSTVVDIVQGMRAIEANDFPFEQLSEIAEAESWRKEINRPIYHIHKWWAQRLGSVFRAIIIGSLAPREADVMKLFHSPTRFPDAVVFDPFMGSGTTAGEALKLGARAVGRDINPVANFLVRNGLGSHDREKIERTFEAIEADVADRIGKYYRATLPDGQIATVLYYFWVKQVSCPSCQHQVDLFRSRIFAKHAYPSRHPTARASCPSCGSINTVRYDARNTICSDCQTEYDPSQGAATGRHATCPSCNECFAISSTVRATGTPPCERMYAKLVLRGDGTKTYEAITTADLDLYKQARDELSERPGAYPIISIEPGYNTNQALGYGYRRWHEMFNARQLLCLSILGQRVAAINDTATRELFGCLFSGTLEFNNMFASYKGEGTGAVRHMFAHHILKPERTPLEANLWGTRKSSGSFSTMFAGRIRRALDYAEHPFELAVSNSEGKRATQKVYGLSEALGHKIADNYSEFDQGERLYLSCGDSSRTDLPDGSVDAIVTDPPFFDNVHYSQLADFFHVWQQHVLGGQGNAEAPTTRSDREVQNEDADEFAERLGAVWHEAHRVMKNDGVMAFSYHHSRPEGWSAVLYALMTAGFVVTAAQPIKAEMSVATPKRQAKEPIDLDLIVVCRKRGAGIASPAINIEDAATSQVARFYSAGRKLSRNDVRVIVMGQALSLYSHLDDPIEAVRALEDAGDSIEEVIENAHEISAEQTTS